MLALPLCSLRMTARFFLFGSPTVEYGGERLALPFERRNQLLAFLALKRSWVGRAELAATLWPEQETKLAYANLRKILHRLQSLSWARGIESQGGAIRFAAETDVSAFDSALREQRAAEALALRSGELLAGFEDDRSEAWTSWLGFERDRLRLAWRDTALGHLAAEIDPAEGIDLSKQLLETDPLDEAALRAHMSWLARGGQSARARQAYRDFVERLKQDLGLTPGAELRALHDSIGSAVWSPAAPASAPAKPIDADFVGRTVELRRIGALLAQNDCRLICLMGPGGVGKTRLAQRALHEFATRFSDDAVFVPLEDVHAASEFAGRLARALDIRLAGGTEPVKQLVEFLRTRHMLLVLDNFEQLAANAAILTTLLQACSKLKIIVTSRVRLALAIEWLLPLEGLPCPEVEDVDHFEAFDAVRLFVHAAHRVEPALVPAVEAASIVDICRQLEGLPLAIELAAAWTRVLSCDAIAAELRHGTELLHAVDAAQPSRHASIDVVFDQSWRLLSEAERDALSRLSVFVGGFAQEAARSVASATLPVIGALADKSLLRKEQTRLYLHPLVQQMAAARLSERTPGQTTQAAHAAYFHRLLAQLHSATSAGERNALKTIDLEFENCRRAWGWSIEHGPVEAVRRSSETLLDYCDFRGRFEDGLMLLRQATQSPLALADAPLQALLLSRVAHLEYRLNRFAEAESTARRALEQTRRNQDHATKRQAFNVLATCALQTGRLDEARRYFKHALEANPPDDHAHGTAVTLDHLALVEKRLGHYDEALRLSLQSLMQHRQLGDSAGEALCLNNLASLSVVRKEYEAAREYLQQSLAICERDGIVTTQGLVFCNLMDVAIKTGDLSAAQKHAQRALEVASATNNQVLVSWIKTSTASLAVRQGDIEAARSNLSEGLSLALALGTPPLKFDAVMCFSEILQAQGEAVCARRLLAYAAEHPTASGLARDQLRTRLGNLSTGTGEDLPWPGLELDELLHRVVVETSLGYAPLIATLRPPP